MKMKPGPLVYDDGKFYKEILLFALPVALQGMITDGINLTDTLMIGSLGELQLSAASLATQFVNTYRSFSMGLSMGASVLASRFWGMQDMGSLKKVIAIMYRLSLVLAAVFGLLTFSFPGVIMRLYTAQPQVIRYGTEYLKYCTMAYFFNGLSITTTVILRSIRKVRLALYVSIAGFFINIAANYIFMFGKLGAPAMGLSGAAFSTLLVRIYECAVICGYLLLAENKLRFRFRDLFARTGGLVREYVHFGLPVLISDILLSFGENVVMMVIGRLGTAFVAANAIVSVISRLTGNLIQGVSQASSVMVGNTLGRGQIREAERQGWAFLGIGILLGTLSAAIILLITEPVVGMYRLTEETAAITRHLMYAVSLIMIFQASNMILTKGALRGGGDTKVLVAADNLFLWISSIPLGLLAGFVWHAPVFWIYICLRMDNILKTIWCIWRLKSRRWIKAIRTV